MKKFIFIPIILVLLLACSKYTTPLQTVSNVKLEKYTGLWYEIARYEHFFEKGCKNVTAKYTIVDDGKISVANSCVNMKTNQTKVAMGVAYPVDETNSKLKVSFFRPFYGDYYIIMLDEDYKYAVVGSPSREYLWILSRTKKLDKDILKQITKILPSIGFDTKKLIWTVQE